MAVRGPVQEENAQENEGSSYSKREVRWERKIKPRKGTKTIGTKIHKVKRDYERINKQTIEEMIDEF